MRHDQPADQPRGDAPGSIPHVLEAAGSSLILHAERLGEILAEVVRGARLQRLVILHQGFNGVRAQRARELLALRLHAGDHGHRHPLLGKAAVDAENGFRLALGIRLIDVRRMPFLPQEFRGAEEQPGPELPAHDIGPLVQEQRQIAVALDPLGEHRVDDRFRRRPNDERLFELRAGVDLDRAGALLAGRAQPRVCHERDFLRETFHMLGFLGEEAHRDEQREVRIAVPRRAEHVVQGALHQLPDAIAVWTNHHAAPHRRIVRQLGLSNDVPVPLAEILGAWRDLFSLCHQSKYPLRSLSIGTLASVPALKSRTTARPAFLSSGPIITARGAPRADASSSCLRTPACRSPYSTAIPFSRIAWASRSMVGMSSPPTATKKAPSSIDALGATPRSLRSSPSTTSPMPNPSAGRSSRPS